MFVQGLFGCAMGGLITVERDFKRQSALTPESKPEEGLGRSDVPLGAKQEIDGLSLFVDGTVEIGPASFDFDVGLVDAPGPSSWPSEAVPAFLEFGRIALNPTHDRRVRHGESTFGHHLHEITKAEFVAQIPADTEDDYFRSKWRPLKRSSMLSTRQLYRSNNQPASYAALTQFAPEPKKATPRSTAVRMSAIISRVLLQRY